MSQLRKSSSAASQINKIPALRIATPCRSSLSEEETVRRRLLGNARIRVLAKGALLRHLNGRRQLMLRTNPVETAEFAQSFAVKLDHLIDCQVAHGVHGVRLLGQSFEQTSPILNDFATGGPCGGIARVPMRTNDDRVVLDAHFDFGIGFDVDLLEKRPIEDQASRVSKSTQLFHEWHDVVCLPLS
jgi:hypothetical protein